MNFSTFILTFYYKAVLGEQPRVSDGSAIRPMGVKERDEKENKII
jgi:hypothetical protein